MVARGARPEARRGERLFGPDKDRGALVVLPVANRERFVAALALKTHEEAGRTLDELADLVCTAAAGRYVCARKLVDIDAAAGRHSPPLAAAAAHLSPDDQGDAEFYATLEDRNVAKLAEQAKLLGTIWASRGRFDSTKAARGARCCTCSAR